MEAGMGLDNLRVRLHPAAAFGLDLFQLVEGGEDPIGKRLGQKAARVAPRAAPLGNTEARTPGGSLPVV